MLQLTHVITCPGLPYVKDVNKKIGQFHFLDKELLTSTSYNLIIIIVLTVVVENFQKILLLLNVFVILCHFLLFWIYV